MFVKLTADVHELATPVAAMPAVFLLQLLRRFLATLISASHLPNCQENCVLQINSFQLSSATHSKAAGSIALVAVDPSKVQ